MIDPDPFDLETYLARIGWHGERAARFDVLAGVLGAHMAAIPFENLDVLLGRPPRLDLACLQAKLVGARRGGYCFEHATLLGAALEAMGFDILRHSARVTMFVPREQAPRTHMFLSAALPEGRFVLDPGFGALAARVPVPLDGRTVRCGREAHALRRDGAWWVLDAQNGDDAAPLAAWSSTLEADQPIDFEMANHYVATHPASAFVNGLMLRALTPEGRVTVRNRDAAVWRDGVAQAFELADRRELRRLIAAHFGFDLPEVETMRVAMVAGWD